MRLPFRRRRILEPFADGSGMVTEWLIPYDASAKDNEDAPVSGTSAAFCALTQPQSSC